MADSILEKISQNLLTTLNEMSIANGYSANILFSRPLRKGRDPLPDTGVLFLTQLQETAEQDVSNQLQRWIASYEIEIYLFFSEDLTTTVDSSKANIFADITKLLMTDAQRGVPHLAFDTFVNGFESFMDAEGSFEGISIEFDVDFRVFRNDPYITG